MLAIQVTTDSNVDIASYASVLDYINTNINCVSWPSKRLQLPQPEAVAEQFIRG